MNWVEVVTSSEYALQTCGSEAWKWWCCYSWWFPDDAKFPRLLPHHLSLSPDSNPISADVARTWRRKSVIISRQSERLYVGEYLDVVRIGLRCVLYSGRHVFRAQSGRCSVNVDQSRILWDFTVDRDSKRSHKEIVWQEKEEPIRIKRLPKGIGEFRIGNEGMYVTLINCSVWLVNDRISRYTFARNHHRIMR